MTGLNTGIKIKARFLMELCKLRIAQLGTVLYNTFIVILWESTPKLGILKNYLELTKSSVGKGLLRNYRIKIRKERKKELLRNWNYRKWNFTNQVPRIGIIKK
jgi:hypothetical protein